MQERRNISNVEQDKGSEGSRRVWETPTFHSSATFERLALACTGAPVAPLCGGGAAQKDPCNVVCVASS